MTAVDGGFDAPLSARRRALAIAGCVMAAGQVAAAAALAPPEGDARAGVLAALWAVSVAWSVVAVLLLTRQADVADLFTASMLVAVSAYVVYAAVAALDARGTDAERNLVDTLFFGVTTGALTALVIWAICALVARILRLPGAIANKDPENPRS